MVDYFDANAANGAASAADAGAVTNGAAATNGGEDLGMDEISVSVAYLTLLFLSMLTSAHLVNHTLTD